MIQILMLVSLGFFAATLLALLIAPAAWARAVRLTSHRIRASLPINETEIRAEKDQLRATHAVVVHQLEKKIERAEMGAARQRVELNRREARIADLEQDGVQLTAQLDENRNARHVLAQTLNERLPRAEERLRETRDLLQARDSQVAKFVKAATQQHIALAEASAQIRQQDDELRRLQAALMARQYAVRQRVPAESLEQTAALQSEVQELRERTASQSRLIERIQEAERTQIQNADPADMAETITEVQSTELQSDSQGIDEAPQGFAARFNRWRVALQKEKETTSRLRAELANVHDRAAKQSAHYREELRELSQSGVVSVPVPGDIEARAERRSSYRDNGQTLLSKAGLPNTATNGNGSTPNGENAVSNGKTNGNGNGKSAAAIGEAVGHGEAPQKSVDVKKKSDASTNGRGNLTERIKKQQETNDESSDRSASTIASSATRKSGTLLQRLKGMEDA